VGRRGLFFGCIFLCDQVYQNRVQELSPIAAMTFREATSDDLSAILRLLADDPLGTKRESLSHREDRYQVAFDRILEDLNQQLIVVTTDQQVIGTMQLSFLQYLTYQGGLRMQIEAVRVHTDFRSKGLGKEMIAWAINKAREQNAHMVQLTSDLERPEAIAFYEKLGFVASHAGMKLHLG
jgi:GNAT superfamily N-acetyltransferase